jgi:hypothetical protein
MAASNGGLRRRARLETVLAVVSGALAVLTLVWHDWIEVFGWEPDGGSGLAEWAVVGGLALVAVASGVAARGHWRLAAAAEPTT